MISCGMSSRLVYRDGKGKTVEGRGKPGSSKRCTVDTPHCADTGTEKLLHPFMPFITEEIYCTLLPDEESIMISDWPVYRDEMDFADAEKAVSSFQEVVRGIRNTRNEMNVPQNRKTNIYIVGRMQSAVHVLSLQRNPYKPCVCKRDPRTAG